MKELPRGYWGLNIDHIIQKGDIHGGRNKPSKSRSRMNWLSVLALALAIVALVPAVVLPMC